jgi:hypothetical protein
VSVGFAYVEIGAFERAERALRDALAVGERMQLDNAVVTARTQLGRAIARRGGLDEGRKVEEQAVLALHAQGNKFLEGAGRTYLSWTLQQQGDLAAAEREAVSAVEVLAGIQALRGAALAQLATVQLEQARASDALTTATEAMRVLETAAKTVFGESSIRLAFARALHATGDTAAATTAITLARERVDARAKMLADADLRSAFTNDIREHAMTYDLARQWIA